MESFLAHVAVFAGIVGIGCFADWWQSRRRPTRSLRRERFRTSRLGQFIEWRDNRRSDRRRRSRQRWLDKEARRRRERLGRYSGSSTSCSTSLGPRSPISSSGTIMLTLPSVSATPHIIVVHQSDGERCPISCETHNFSTLGWTESDQCLRVSESYERNTSSSATGLRPRQHLRTDP
jgi:hypothetical protein